MSPDPNAPPTAAVDPPTGATREAGAPLYFPVSALKLVVMSLCTLGLYEVYWFYMNWRLLRTRGQPDIWPAARAIFSVLYCFAMFSAIRRDGVARAIGPAPAMGLLTTGWIFLGLTWKLPDPLWLMSLLTVTPMLPVQAYVNRLNAEVAPRHDPNRRFSGLNWLGIVVGMPLLAGAIVATFALMRVR